MNILSIYPFISVLLTLGFLPGPSLSVLQPTRNVSIQADLLQYGNIKLFFICPNFHAPEDKARYYKVDKGIKWLIQKQKSQGLLLNIKSPSDLGEYECSVLSKDNTTRNATLNIMDANVVQSPSKFEYDVSETKYLIQDSGSVDLDCGETNGEPVTWYRPPQYHIHTGEKLSINSLSNFDFGTYYCAVGATSKSVLKVKKVIVLPNEPAIREKNIDREVTYFENVVPRKKEIRYIPGNIAGKIETVTWEQPPGTILLDHGRQYYIQSFTANKTLEPLYYRINRNGDYTINKVGKVFIEEWKDREVEISIEGRFSYGSEMKVACDPSPKFGNNTKVLWRKNDKIVHHGNTYVIPNFQKKLFGQYSCEIHKDGVKIISKVFNLSPEKDVKSKIEMTPDNGLYYSYHEGKNIELHCELPRGENDWEMKSSDIEWTFDGRKIDTNNKKSAFGNIKRFNRLDRKSVSILVLKDTGEDNEGTYKCFQGSAVYAATLIMEKSEVLAELAPPKQTVADNVNQVAEFHCRIDTVGYNSSLIHWTFIPEGSQVEEALPAEMIVEKPNATISTSFITTYNALKRHEGTYVCRVLGRKLHGKLIVKARPVLTVTPREIITKPGNDARFYCTLFGVSGDVIWRRRDRKSFDPKRELRKGGTTGSLLEVLRTTRAEDGTVYECSFNKLMESVILRVQDDCALHERKCDNGTCIDETKFCDGKDDCGDNSDEDPTRCNECTPNSIHCDFLNNSNPDKRCIVKHWQCDGTDDCGNNFDELNCPVKNKDKCIGSHFMCDNSTLIPRAYWCDGEADCKSMEDEEGCSSPQVIEPPKMSHIQVVENTTLTLECRISGRPLPTITWRYNWGFLLDKLDYNITTEVSNCSVVKSTLRINNISPDQSGIYTCEGVANRRVVAPDISVTVNKGSICKRPYFNNEAWYQEFCLRCYCSNVTDDCTSASGYITNPDLVETVVKSSDAAIIDYKTDVYFVKARNVVFANATEKMYIINKEQYIDLVPDADHFLGGSFNMRGSWILRYGYPLTYKLILSGESTGHISGPIVVMKGGNKKKIYYCTAKYRIPAYASDDYYENSIRIILWEQDRWFKDIGCTTSVSRPEFMEILKDVLVVLFRIKFFNKQTDFKMSKISMQEAIVSNFPHSWVSRIEKCNCPKGYSGTSCEDRT